MRNSFNRQLNGCDLLGNLFFIIILNGYVLCALWDRGGVVVSALDFRSKGRWLFP